MLVYAGIGPDAGLWLVEVAFVAAGAGLALNTGPAVALAMGAVPQNRTGLASGLVNLARLVGITMGVAVLGSVLARSAVTPAAVRRLARACRSRY